MFPDVTPSINFHRIPFFNFPTPPRYVIEKQLVISKTNKQHFADLQKERKTQILFISLTMPAIQSRCWLFGGNNTMSNSLVPHFWQWCDVSCRVGCVFLFGNKSFNFSSVRNQNYIFFPSSLAAMPKSSQHTAWKWMTQQANYGLNWANFSNVCALSMAVSGGTSQGITITRIKRCGDEDTHTLTPICRHPQIYSHICVCILETFNY